MIRVTLPQLSLAMEEGKVTRWLVANGAQVSAGQPILEIETDKAITEVESPAAGTIRFVVDEGTLAAVEATLAEIEGLAPAIEFAGESAATTTTATDVSSVVKVVSQSTETAPVRVAARQHRASPAARRLARERGIDLSQVHGSGPAGRIVVLDLDGISLGKTPSLREAVVAELEASWRTIPHIHIAGELDGSGLAKAKNFLLSKSSSSLPPGSI